MNKDGSRCLWNQFDDYDEDTEEGEDLAPCGME